MKSGLHIRVCLRFLTALLLFLSLGAAGSRLAANQPPAGAEPVNLAGMVYEAGGNTPVTGATVYLYTARPRVGLSSFCPSCYPDCGKKAATDPSGAFTLTSLDPTLVFRVLVVRKGYQPAVLDKVDPVKGEVIVSLKRATEQEDPNRFTVRGKVVSSDGKPVIGAVVEENAVKWGDSTGFGFGPTREPIAITDEEGRFVFHCVREMKSTDRGSGKETMEAVTALQVIVKARDFAPRKHWLKVNTAEIQPVALETGATLQGMVRDAYGKGVPGVKVIVSQKDRNAETYLGALEIATGPDGTFLLPNVPQGDEFGVTVAMESLLPLGKAVPVQWLKIGAAQEEVQNLSLKLEAATTIRGRVTLAGNKPIPPDTRITLSREDSWNSQQAILASDGSFTFHGVPPGETIVLHLRIPGFMPAPGIEGLKSWGSVERKLSRTAGTVTINLPMVPEPKQ